MEYSILLLGHMGLGRNRQYGVRSTSFPCTLAGALKFNPPIDPPELRILVFFDSDSKLSRRINYVFYHHGIRKYPVCCSLHYGGACDLQQVQNVE